MEQREKERGSQIVYDEIRKGWLYATFTASLRTYNDRIQCEHHLWRRSGDEGKRSEDREWHNNTMTNVERLKVMANFDVVHNDVHVY